MSKIAKVLEAYLIAWIGGSLFFMASFPLPWILGPMSAVILYKYITKRKLFIPKPFYNGGLIILGIYFGLFFTATTFTTVSPYIIPFILTTILLLTISVFNSIVLSKFINVDSITSVFGSIPGGLSEMVAASESLKANHAMVTIFQTVRLLTVVFLVPFIVVQVFSPNAVEAITPSTNVSSASLISYLWFSIAIFVGWSVRNILPAAYVIGPLFVVALLNTIGIDLPEIYPWMLMIGQVTVGMKMGDNISLSDLKIGGKYCGFYFILTLLLIGTSFGLGFLFASLTSLNLSTAMLSLAPGGLVEMALTATSVGADPAIVSSLQLVRLLFIILIVPSFLKWMFRKKKASMINGVYDHLPTKENEA